LTVDPNHSLQERNDLTNDIVNLHFNQIMFFIDRATEVYQDKRLEQVLIDRTKDRKDRFKLKLKAFQNKQPFTYENICGDRKYKDSINFLTKDDNLDSKLPAELTEITCAEFYNKRRTRVRLNSRTMADGKLEQIFKRSKTSFLDVSKELKTNYRKNHRRGDRRWHFDVRFSRTSRGQLHRRQL